MNDRELLTLAAKAAGIEIDHWRADKMPVVAELFRGHLANYEDWNPLTDDGDALRLAVKLRLSVILSTDGPVMVMSHNVGIAESCGRMMRSMK